MEELATPVEPARWVTLVEACEHPALKKLVPNLRNFRWLLGKPHVKRRLVEGDALIKRGKSWLASPTEAAAIIENIYREESLAALNRVASVGHAPSKRHDHAAACA